MQTSTTRRATPFVLALIAAAALLSACDRKPSDPAMPSTGATTTPAPMPPASAASN